MNEGQLTCSSFTLKLRAAGGLLRYEVQLATSLSPGLITPLTSPVISGRDSGGARKVGEKKLL